MYINYYFCNNYCKILNIIITHNYIYYCKSNNIIIRDQLSLCFALFWFLQKMASRCLLYRTYFKNGWPNRALQMFAIFIVCRIAVHYMTSVAATIAWTKDGIVNATWTNRKLGKLENKANPKAARGQRWSIFMRDRFAVESVARRNEETIERTGNEQIYLHIARETRTVTLLFRVNSILRNSVVEGRRVPRRRT